MRPDLPSLKLPRIVSQGLAGAAISSSRPPSKAAGARLQEGQLDALGGQVLADRAGHDGVALGCHAPDDLDGRAGQTARCGPPWTPRMRLGVAFKPEPPDPRARDGVLRHAAGRDVDLHDPPAAEWRLPPPGSAFARVASWVSTMPPMLHGAERERPVGRRKVQTLGCPRQGMSEIAQLLGPQRRVRARPVWQRGRRLERVVAGQHGREARLVREPEAHARTTSDRRLRTAIAVSSRALPTAAVAQSTRTARSPRRSCCR